MERFDEIFIEKGLFDSVVITWVNDYSHDIDGDYVTDFVWTIGEGEDPHRYENLNASRSFGL